MSMLRPFVIAAFLLGACGEDSDAPAAQSDAASAPAAAASARSLVEVQSERGQSWATLKPKDDGYRLQGGSLDGAKVKVDGDRVKLKQDDRTLAKAKLKDYGFKVYSDDETAVAKVKRKGAGFKVSPPEGDAWGELSASGGTLGGQAVVIETEGDRHVVKRGDTVVGTVGTSIQPRAAAFLAVTEIAMEQRVAAMVLVQEKVQ